MAPIKVFIFEDNWMCLHDSGAITAKILDVIKGLTRNVRAIASKF